MKDYEPIKYSAVERRSRNTTSLAELVFDSLEHSTEAQHAELMEVLQCMEDGFYKVGLPAKTQAAFVDVVGKQLSRISEHEVHGARKYLVRFPRELIYYHNDAGKAKHQCSHDLPVTLRSGPYVIVPWSDVVLSESMDYVRNRSKQRNYDIIKCRVGRKILPVVYAPGSVRFNLQHGGLPELVEIPCGLRPPADDLPIIPKRKRNNIKQD